MIRGLSLCLAAFVACCSISHAAEKPALEPGNYIVYFAFNPDSPEQAFALIKVDKQGDKLVAALLQSPPMLESKLKDITVNGRDVLIAFDMDGRTLTFEGLVTAKNNKSALGS